MSRSLRLREGVLAVLLCGALATFGCEKKSGTPPAAPPAGGGTTPAPTAGGTPAPAATGAQEWPAETGVIVGVVKCAADVPMKPIAMAAKPECEALHTVDKPMSELVIKGANGGLKDVVVYVSSGVESYQAPPPPKEPVVLDQRGCVYAPHVFACRVKQDLKVVNSDPFLHNVNSAPLNLAMNKPGEELLKKHFKKQVVGKQFKCDVHPWMSAWACAFDHPCFAVTDADGNFRIENVPPGKVKLAFWHEPAPGIKVPAAIEIEVKAGEEVTAPEVSY